MKRRIIGRLAPAIIYAALRDVRKPVVVSIIGWKSASNKCNSIFGESGAKTRIGQLHLYSQGTTPIEIASFKF